MPKDDRKSIDLGQQQTKQKDGLKIQSPLKSSTNAKRNIVDTFLHTSCMFGHDPTLGLGFSYTWEVGVKGLMKGWIDLMECGLCPTSDGLPSGVFSTLVSVLFGF